MQTTISGRGPYNRGSVAALFSAGVLLSTLLLWPLLGNGAAYVALVLALPAALLDWRGADWARVRRAPVTWAFCGSFVLLTLAFLLQPGWPSVSSIDSFAIFAVAPVLAMALAPVARTRLNLEQLAILCIIGAALACGVGIYGMLLGEGRATAPSFSPIHFAAFAVTLGFMGLGLSLFSTSAWRWLAIAGPLLGFAAAIASGTRSALIVGCALALLYGLFWMQRRAMPLWVKILMPIALAGSVVLAFYIASLMGFSRPFDALRATWGSFTGDLGNDRSTAYRIEMYRGGWQAILDAPLLGHGWLNQIAAAYPYFSEMARDGYAREGWAYIHNEAMSFTVAAGIFGFVAYCLVMLAPLLTLGRHREEARWGLRAYLATTFTLGIFVSGMTDVFFMVEMPKLAMVVMTAALLLVSGNSSKWAPDA